MIDGDLTVEIGHALLADDRGRVLCVRGGAPSSDRWTLPTATRGGDDSLASAVSATLFAGTGVFVYETQLSAVFSRDTPMTSHVTFMPKRTEVVVWPDTLRGSSRWLVATTLLEDENPYASYYANLFNAMEIR